MRQSPRGFFSELKRRRVLRVAGAYLVASFVALQAADYLFRALLFPDWAFRLVVVVVLLGFIIAVPLAWAYDLSPEGIRRTPPAEVAGASGPEAAPSSAPGVGSAAMPGSPAALAAADLARAQTAGSSGRPRRARDLAIGAAVGVLVGVPVALFGAGVLHAVTPRAFPRAVGAGALAVGVVLALVDSVVGLLIARRARRAHRAGEVGTVAGVLPAGPSGRLGEGLGFALGVLVALSGAYTLAPRQERAKVQAGGFDRSLYVAVGAGTFKAKVAVTRFENLTGDATLEPVGRLAEDWVTRRLRSMPEAQVVAIAPTAAADTSAEAVTALAHRTGADVVVFGSYYREGDDVLLAARLVPPRGGRLPPEMASVPIGPVRVPRDRPVAGAERLAAMVAGAVATACVAPECFPGRRPPTYEARQLWSEAVEAWRKGDHQTEMQKFRQAISEDSTFASAYTAMAEHSSSCALKDSLGEAMEARREDFSEFDLYFMRAIRAACRGDMEAAYQFRRRAGDFAPTVYGAQVGVAQYAYLAGRLAEAERRFEALGPGGGWGAGWYANLTNPVLHLQGKFARELTVAEEGRRRYPDSVNRSSLGWRGLAALGRTAALEARFDEARRADMDLPTLAVQYVNAAAELEWHGHPQAARLFAERALRELERMPPEARHGAAYHAIRGTALIELGRWHELDGSLDSATEADRRLMTLRGISAARSGDPARARALLVRIGQLPDFAFAGYPQREVCEAGILAALGERSEALRRLADGQARRTLPRSDPNYAHSLVILRDLWHDPELDRMFAARE